MPEHSTTVRDMAVLKVARVGRVEKSDDPLRPFRLVDADGTEVAAVSGHAALDTTMGYAAIYPQDVISHHRAFSARRRTERPSEEYRELTATEWDEFLSHFELRKVALETCSRDYATPCQHENACVRCPLLLVDPAQMPRLQEIHANLVNRLQEAKDQGWLGEVAAIETTMAAAAQKLEAMRDRAAQPSTVHLGMPDIHSSVGRITPPL
ncbi:integrase [Streptomyces sp. NBC_01007]|nr:integrase [Streptomyces sp. NBC_01007]